VVGFETAKRAFALDTKEDLKVEFRAMNEADAGLPVIPEINMKQGFIRMPVETIRAVFDEYLDIVNALVNQQLKELEDDKFAHIKTKSIFLVGGGTLIPYISATLKEAYTRPGQSVMNHDDNNCSLVARGALMAAIDPEIGRRELCSTTYGLLINVSYDSDDPRHKEDRY
jgi:molecular chaperone DnaK (HSP70)